MKGVDFPLLFIAAASLLGFGVQHQNYKHLNDKVEGISETKKEVARLKAQYDIVLEELDKVRKLSSSADSMKDLAGALGSSAEKRQLSEASPFTKIDGWWVADEKMFRFPQGIVIGDRNEKCEYGNATLSVGVVGEYEAGNCPSGEGSVTFGSSNEATGPGSSVTGGSWNTASGEGSSVTGGFSNRASGFYASATGDTWNIVTGDKSSVTGGQNNKASGDTTSLADGTDNKARDWYSSVLGGSSKDAIGCQCNWSILCCSIIFQRKSS